MSGSKSARRRAEDKSAKAKQHVPDAMEYQRQRLEAETAKFVRLRALRLAKEAAEKETRSPAASKSSTASKPVEPARRKPRQDGRTALARQRYG
jgi:hypothetical protein